MCLRVKKNSRIRRKSIEVWKVVKVRDGKRLSPYRSVPLPSTSDVVLENVYGSCYVEIGLHAFTTEGGAKYLKNMFENAVKDGAWEFCETYDLRKTDTFEIIRGYTPKSARYYIGAALHLPAIASTAIVWES